MSQFIILGCIQHKQLVSIGGSRCLYSPYCREEKFSETGFPAREILGNPVASSGVSENSGNVEKRFIPYFAL